MANGTMTTGNVDASTLSSLANDLAALSRAAGALQKKIDALDLLWNNPLG